MNKFLNDAGLSILWNKIKTNFQPLLSSANAGNNISIKVVEGVPMISITSDSGYNIRKTYESVDLMNADVASPMGTDGEYIKVGEIVTVVNSTTPSENGIYSYEGATDGWKYQSSFNFQVEQVRSQDTNTSPSSKLFDDELVQLRSDLNDDFGHYVENPEYARAYTDTEGRFLWGIKQDGSIEFVKGVPTSIKNYIIEFVFSRLTPLEEAHEQYLKESENPEWARVIVDADGRVLWGIHQDGSVEFTKGVPSVVKNYIDSLGEEVERINQLVISLLADVNGLTDTYHYISNPEWASAIVDSEERILMGIKADGTFYVPNRELYHVESNPEYAKVVVDPEGHVLFGIKNDGSCYIPKGISEEAKQGLLELTSRISWFETESHPEWLQVTTDSEGKILEGIGNDGKRFFPKQEMLEKYEDVEGRTEITLDKDGKILSFRDSDGIRHEGKQYTEVASFGNMDLTSKNATQIEEALKNNGFTSKSPIDWSDNEFVEIPLPRTCAMINIIASKLGTAKGEDIEGFVEYWDKDGNYFKKPIILNAQGTSSMTWWKKNQALDIDDGSKIKFGNWVAQDSFHIKKYYIDVFRGQSIVGYHVIESMYKDREYGNQRPWDYLNNNNSTKEGLGNIKSDFESGALAHPDGFPVMLYINGTLDGLYAWGLKKDRDNYWMKKNDDKHIILDGAIGKGKMFGQNASEIIWYDTVNPGSYGFEVRNPKTLVYQEYDSITQGFKYDGEVNKEIAGIDKNYQGEYIAGSSYSKNQIVSLNDHYFISSVDNNTDVPSLSGNKDNSPNYAALWINCTQSVKVKQAIQRLAESTINLNSNPTKEEFEKYYIVDQFIDYWIISQVLYNWDGFDKNWIWCTWDGIKWCPTLYDADSIFGMTWNGTGMISPSFNSLLGNDSSLPSYYLYTLYSVEIESRYKELRDKDIISAETITRMLLSWLERCGYDNLTTDIEECCAYNGVPQTPSYRDGSKTYVLAPTTGGFYNSPMRVKNWLKDHISYLDNVLEYV